MIAFTLTVHYQGGTQGISGHICPCQLAKLLMKDACRSVQGAFTYLRSPNFLLMTAPTVEKADVVFSDAVLTTAVVFWYLHNTYKLQVNGLITI